MRAHIVVPAEDGLQTGFDFPEEPDHDTRPLGHSFHRADRSPEDHSGDDGHTGDHQAIAELAQMLDLALPATQGPEADMRRLSGELVARRSRRANDIR